MAAEAIAAARRPVLYAGGGVVHAEAAVELAALARLVDLPVTTTLMALGAYPASDHRWLGMLGMHGTRTANWAMDEADLIDRGRRAVRRPRHRRPRVVRPARADRAHRRRRSRDRQERRSAHPRRRRRAPGARPACTSTSRRWRLTPSASHPGGGGSSAGAAQHPPRIAEHPEGAIDAEAALDALQAVTRGQAIVTTDVGQHQMWAANRLRFDLPRRWLTSGGLGTMGFGLPAALGRRRRSPQPRSCA